MHVRVPASTSNLGAGFDCVGIAVDLWLEARLVPGAGRPIYTGTLASIDPVHDLIIRNLSRTPASGDVHLEVHSDIPVGKGLGSSAAALAAAFALSQIAGGGELDRDAVFAKVTAVEGHPDNAGPAVYGGLVLAAGKPVKRPIHPDIALAFAIPDLAIDTKAARALLPSQVSRETAIDQARRAAALITGLEHGDAELIGFGMEDQLAVPHRKRLIPGFDHAVAAGREAGAYGVTISGAGSALVAVTSHARASHVATAIAMALSRAGCPAAHVTPGIAEGLVCHQ